MATLVAAYADRLYRLALRLTGDPRDAEDVVRDSLRIALGAIDTLGQELPFGAWLYRIVARTAGQAVRAERGRRSEVTRHAPWRCLVGHRRRLEAAIDWSSDLEAPAIQTELRTVLAAAIRELSLDDRVAFVLRDVEGLTSSTVAAVLEISPVAVRSRVHRSRLFVRKQLAAYMDARRLHRRAAGGIQYDE